MDFLLYIQLYDTPDYLTNMAQYVWHQKSSNLS